MEVITRKEWLKQGAELFGPDWRNWAFVCPVCKTKQTAKQLMEVSGYGEEKVQSVLGFSCIGRFNNAGEYNPARKEPKFGCNWSLGGLFRLHTLEVRFKDDDGKEHTRPIFEFYKEEPQACKKPSHTPDYGAGVCTLKKGHPGECWDESHF